jgi:hypothetical protein
MTTAKTTAKTAAKDAIVPLKADHQSMSKLFAEHERTRSVPNKKVLVAEICTAPSVHAQIEEEIFCSGVRATLKDKLQVPEATVERGGMEDLIAQLEGVEPDGEMHDAKVKVLSGYVKHHVKEEQGEMFPKAKISTLDLDEPGARMAVRKRGLLARAA